MTKHWLTCPGIGLGKSGVKPVAREAVKRDSSHACPTAGLEVGKYMGWGASVALEPTQVALSLDDSDCGYELLSFSVAWPNYEEPDKNKTLHPGGVGCLEGFSHLGSHDLLSTATCYHKA